MLARLDIHNVRNLRQVSVPTLGRVNIFSGVNGSGKTSVLESIHLLAMSRSFRGRGFRSLIAHGEAACTVYGSLMPGVEGGVGHSIGVERSSGGDLRIKVDGEPLSSVTELVQYLPVQVINADSFDLLTGSPASRRRYLDWGVFHVEHVFLSAWQRFQRCLKQRNKLLRHGKMSAGDLDAWTHHLADAGERVHKYREAYFQTLLPRVEDLTRRLVPDINAIEIRYKPGWDQKVNYLDALEQGSASDKEQGYTHSGPQRADLRITVNGHLAAETLSRGQQKLVVCAMKLSQGQMYEAVRPGKSCIYLIDDLPSELDRDHSRLVCEQLDALNAQVMITCVEGQEISRVWPLNDDGREMFHVEHGTVSKINDPVPGT